MSALANETREHWQALSPLLTIRTERDHAAAVDLLNELIDEIGDDERHPLYDFLDTLGTLVHVWEEAHVDLPESDGVGALEFLMEEHGIAAEDLRDLPGARDILERKRELRLDEIRALASRFRVSPAVFV